MSSEPIPTHYRRQNDMSQRGNPEFILGLAVYLDEVIDGPDGPSGSIAMQIGPITELGEARAKNHHPTNVDIYAALHYAMTSLSNDPDVKAYQQTLAKKVRTEDMQRRLTQAGKLSPTKMQRVERQSAIHNEVRDAATQAILRRVN